MAEVVEKSHKRPELAQGHIDRAIIPKSGPRKVRDVTTSDLAQTTEAPPNERGGNG